MFRNIVLINVSFYKIALCPSSKSVSWNKTADSSNWRSALPGGEV